MSLRLPAARLLADISVSRKENQREYTTLDHPRAQLCGAFLCRQMTQTLSGILSECLLSHPDIHRQRPPFITKQYETSTEGESVYIQIWSKDPIKATPLSILKDAFKDMQLLMDYLYCVLCLKTPVTSNTHVPRTYFVQDVISKSTISILPQTSPDRITLSFPGIPLCVVNALRRVLMTHTPTIKCHNYWAFNREDGQSVSLPYDFSQRLRDIPIIVDNTQFYFDLHAPPCSYQPLFPIQADGVNDKGHGIAPRPQDIPEGEFRLESPLMDDHNPLTTLVFKIHAQCTFDPVTKQLVNSMILSDHIQWVPLPGQEQLASPPRFPKDIELCPLGENKCLDLIILAQKGLPHESAKYLSCNAWINEMEDVSEDQDNNLLHIESLHGLPVSYFLEEGIKYLSSDIGGLALCPGA